MLEVGALTTSTPALVAASTSTLSRPTPARATTFSFGAAASASASTRVALRTMRASTSARAGSSWDRSAPSVRRTSKSSSSRASPAGESSSATSTAGLGTACSLGFASGCRVLRPGKSLLPGSGSPAVRCTGNGRGPAASRPPGPVRASALQPAHQGAQLRADLLDRLVLLRLAALEEVRPAGVELGHQLPGVGAVLDLGQDAAHLLAGLVGDHPRAAGVAAVLGVVRYRPVHLGDAALVHEVDDQLDLVQALEVGDLGLVAGLGEGGEARLDQLGQAAAEHRLLAEEVGLGLLGEGGLQRAGAGAADPLGVGERQVPGGAGGVLLDRDQDRDAAPLLELAADQVARAL